jgi:uncharacterized membrane protein YidH (DUF202 family)
VTRGPGLQPERTQLAWWRTTLGITAGAATILRYAEPGTATAAGPVLMLGLAALATLMSAWQRGRSLRNAAPTAPPEHLVLCLTGASAVAGIGALVLTCR